MELLAKLQQTARKTVLAWLPKRAVNIPARCFSLLPENVVENVMRLSVEDPDDDDDDCAAAQLAESCKHFYSTWRKMILSPGPHATAIAEWLVDRPSPIETLLSCGSLEVDELLQLILKSYVDDEEVAG